MLVHLKHLWLKLTEADQMTNGGVHEGPSWKVLKLRDQIENNK